MEATIIRKDEREYYKAASFREMFSNRIVSLEKGEFLFMLSKIEAHGKVLSHDHKESQLNLIEKGSARMKVGEKEYILQEGDLIVVPGGAVHEMESHADGQAVSHVEVKWLEA